MVHRSQFLADAARQFSRLIPILTLCLILGCNNNPIDKDTGPDLFERVLPEESGVDFRNEVASSDRLNIFKYRNFYNGGGVAIGDINNDGLADLYFTHNTKANRLYLNKGNFKFEDITETAGVAGKNKWSTGVVMVDINADGLLDLYVCNAGFVEDDDQENELFINNGDLTFTEKAAAYGLNENGYTTHAAFFDYDVDGDLDVYILNNSFIPVNTLNYSNKREIYARDWPVRDFLKGGGDKLLRNDDGKYVDVSESAGIFGSLIGYGLGITVGDINGDLLPDMYVSNDFFERDYLYINQGDGTFTEEIKDWMQHISLSSMGADMADINNDGYPEVFVTDMLPDNEYRLKTTSSFESYQVYDLKLKRDFYHQYMQNTLQLNNQDETFSEIAFFSGVAASDWSWGALVFDMDNDGYRDIYVCNGIYQDVTDQDFIDFFANEIIQEMVLTGKKEEMENISDKMPSVPIANKAYRNRGDLRFDDVSDQWGFGEPSFSNGAAYGDLDNDGDQDLVINNLNQPAFIYRNTTRENQTAHYLAVTLTGTANNPFAVGAKIAVHRGDEILNTEQIPSRGFQSSIDYKTLFGLGTSAEIDSLVVTWPDGKRSALVRPPVDTLISVSYQSSIETAVVRSGSTEAVPSLLSEVETSFAAHEEDPYVDFYYEGLLAKKLSREGPAVAIGDVNGDALPDLFIGGAHLQAAQLYLQTPSGLEKMRVPSFENGRSFEDTGAAFFDSDGDGDLDLYVGSGGNYTAKGTREKQDRIYLNDGSGQFTLDVDALPINGLNTSKVLPFDFDKDGDQDILALSRSIPNDYGSAPTIFLWENDGVGTYRNAGRIKAPELLRLGMLTDAVLADLTGNGEKELVVTGEWISPTIFSVEQGRLQKMETDLDAMPGWWYAVEAQDLDNDGDQDLILGNRGENHYFSASKSEPAKLWVSDFDGNGTVENIITRSIAGKDMPVPLKKELTEQLVSLKKENIKHTDYANKSIQDLLSEEQLEAAMVRFATHFSSLIAINEGSGKFKVITMDPEIQFSCVCGIACHDLNGDGLQDIVLGGNDYGFAPQFSRLDASFGHVLINQGNGNFQRLPNRVSGFSIKGEVKALEKITINQSPHLLVAINNEKPRLFKLQEQTDF